MKITKNANGKYDGVLTLGSALCSKCKDCDTIEQAVQELFEPFI